jgi:hypothetical protein
LYVYVGKHAVGMQVVSAVRHRTAISGEVYTATVYVFDKLLDSIAMTLPNSVITVFY